MSFFVALVVLIALAVAAALCATGAFRPLAILSAALGVATPFFVETSQPILVLYLGVYASLVAMRTLDLVRDPTAPRPVRRLLHLHALVDTRLVTSRDRTLESRQFLAGLVWLVVAMLALVAVLGASFALAGPVRFAARWAACALMFMAVFETFARLLPAAGGLVGLQVPEIQDHPWASLSVREFWGVRWNQLVGRWLREHFYEPLHRRGHPGLGIALAFVVSAALHSSLILASLDAFWASLMALFFVLQIAVMAAERVLDVARWRPAYARAWTIGTLVITSPLFTEPMARIFDPLLTLLPR